MLERHIESRIVDYATQRGMWVRKFTSPSRRGAPDRIFAYRGRVFFIEMKATGEKPTKLQALEHKKMRAAGLTVYVCDSVTQGKKIIDAELNYDADSL